VPVQGIRLAGRATQGVIVLDTAKNEKVVSVERISEHEPDEEAKSEGGDGEAPDGASDGGETSGDADDNPDVAKPDVPRDK